MATPDTEALLYFVECVRSGKLEIRDGAVWRLWEARRGWLAEPRRAEKLTSNGYYMLRTVVKSVGRPLYVMAHRVVWAAAGGEMPDGMQINHINGVKTDNRLSNLELVTCSENLRHARLTGLSVPARGLASGRGKLSDEDVADIRSAMSQKTSTATELAERYGVRPNHIYRVASGSRRVA